MKAVKANTTHQGFGVGTGAPAGAKYSKPGRSRKIQFTKPEHQDQNDDASDDRQRQEPRHQIVWPFSQGEPQSGVGKSFAGDPFRTTKAAIAGARTAGDEAILNRRLSSEIPNAKTISQMAQAIPNVISRYATTPFLLFVVAATSLAVSEDSNPRKVGSAGRAGPSSSKNLSNSRDCPPTPAPVPDAATQVT